MSLCLSDFRKSFKKVWILFSAFIITAQIGFAQAPTITSFSPSQICTGENVTIIGTNFTDASIVKLGNINAASFIVNSATSITTTAAAQSNGTITVTTPKGSVSSANSLTVLAAPIPELTDIGYLNAPFTNCDGNQTYQLKVSNSSTTAGGSCIYEINWGDGSAIFTQTDWPNGATTNHTYNAQGYFNITLTITPANGCKKVKNYKFYNGTNPLASLTTTSPTTGLCAPAAIEFQIGNWFNNSPGTIYELDFGDGKNISLSHPLNPTNSFYLTSHTYTTSSCPTPDFTATLNAINGCFVTKYTLNQIVIRKKPIADFSSSTASPCVNTPVCFTNLTTGGYSGNFCNNASTFIWDFGDGTPTYTGTTPPCHTYATIGTYNVTLSASNAACGNDTKTKQIQVKAVTAEPTVSATPVTYCQNQLAIPLTATGNGLLWYTSTGGFGSTTAPTPSTFFPGNTTYYVSQSGGANGCESPKVPITVTVNAAPNPPSVSDVALCQNQTATALSATGTNLLWYTTPTGTGSATAPTPPTTTIGNTTYYVTQTVNNCESNKAATNVTVNSFPTAPIATPSTIIYCQGQTASPLFVSGNNLRWYTVSTGGTGSLVAPVPQTTTIGTTTYYVSQFTGCGESPRTSITVDVKASPSASIAYTPTNLCNVTGAPSVDAILTGTTGGSYSISPSFGLPIDAATGKLSPAGATPGSYTITYTIPGAGGCGNFTVKATVNVNGTPTATINYPSTICTSELPKSVVVTGSTGGTFSSTTGLTIDNATGTITASTSAPGTYTITYTIPPAAPCPGFTTTATVTITKAPVATISYTPKNLCNVTNTPATPNPPVTVTLTGTSGGTYNVLPATVDLTIDATTGTITPSGATPGNYTITYTIPGSGGCSDLIVTTPVTVSGAPIATLNYPGSPYCHGITIPQQGIITGTNGGSFTSDPKLSIDATTGDINPSLSTPGTYTVTYTIIPSPPCPGYITTASVTIDESPVLTFPASTKTICSGGSAIFTPSSTVANTNYSWNVAGVLPADVVGITSGTSSASAPDINLSFTNTGTNRQTIKIEVTPTNASQNPCDGAPYLLTLNVDPVPPAPIGSDTVNFCLGAPGSALTANALPGNTINWYDENQTALATAPVINTIVPAEFTYYASQSNSYQCEGPKSKILAIVNPTPKIISSNFTSPPTCGVPSGSIVLNILDINNNAMPNTPVTVYYDKFLASYQATDTSDATGKITIPLVGGTYKNIYVEAKGCASQKIPDVFVLKDPTPPAKPVAGYNPPLCTGTQLNLSASSPTSSQTGPIDYVWVGPAFGSIADTNRNTVVTFPNAKVTDGGTYIVYAIQNNCISEEVNFLVDIKQAPTKPQIITNAPLCIGDNLNLQATSSIPGPNPILTYTWAGPGRGFPVNAPNAQINNVITQDAGRYSITVTSPQTGCSTSSDTMIGIGGYPIVRFTQHDYVLPAGNLLHLQPIITNASAPNILPMKIFEWTPSQDIDCNDAVCATPVANIKKDECYIVKATNIYGCSGSDTICVKVFCEKTQVFIPNTFTPQGGLPENSVLMVRGSGIGLIKSFRVFNRWGQIVFEKSNFPPNTPAYGWDGNINGKPAEPAVYVYTAEVLCENGVPFTYKGNVTLLK
ncbi:gliding motility-associated C-terminal domain-containing protein [Ferruginibacter lapsinanis]|uniref:Ig-like domain-containing protein n=1 Tax=Ferruginibacter lapsinanis TaxID=563172 RepID=UPI001E6311E7|nr:PKD domain-containing protein [Ferruginibacter lapsinanis]UEG48636.1 gliding motility-associated C-terminal domain-containing protein [Ferruginibacter lapsinanis]